jgi:hypothetical protein
MGVAPLFAYASHGDLKSNVRELQACIYTRKLINHCNSHQGHATHDYSLHLFLSSEYPHVLAFTRF